MQKIEIDNYIRIDKRKARNLFELGIDIYVYPSNLRPSGPWGSAMLLDHLENFESQVNSATYYSCINSQTGYYLNFYLKK